MGRVDRRASALDDLFVSICTRCATVLFEARPRGASSHRCGGEWVAVKEPQAKRALVTILSGRAWKPDKRN